MIGRVIKFPGAPQEPLAPPPTLGQHTVEVLGDLGYSAADIDRLRRDQVIDRLG